MFELRWRFQQSPLSRNNQVNLLELRDFKTLVNYTGYYVTEKHGIRHWIGATKLDNGLECDAN